MANADVGRPLGRDREVHEELRVDRAERVVGAAREADGADRVGGDGERPVAALERAAGEGEAVGDHRVPRGPHGGDRILAQRRDRARIVRPGLDRAGDDAGRELRRIGVDGTVDEREVGEHPARRVQARQPKSGDRREQRGHVSRRMRGEVEQLASGRRSG